MFAPRNSRLKLLLMFSLVLAVSGLSLLFSQANPTAPAPKKGNQGQIGFRPGARANRKHVLAWADVRNGSQHESIWHALATIEKLGHDSGVYDTVFRTDSQVITKDNMMQSGPDATPGRGLTNLSAFDTIFFYGAAGIDLTPAQKADLLAFIKEDGKGFIAVHTSQLAFPSWPEYGELIGGRYDEHPWTTEAQVIVEDKDFPATKHFPPLFKLREEYYQTKDFSRDKIHVLLRLDPDSVDLKRPLVHRTDKDFPLVWTKMYGKGRVFVSLLNHEIDSWDNKDLQTMYFEAIKWSMGMTDGDITPRPLPTSPVSKAP